MNYAKQNCNENSHPALKIIKCWVLQFCLFPFNFLLSKLTKQFESIMQNKPNFRKAKMKLNSYSTKDYENKSNWKLGENKPNAKPIKANTKPTCSELACTEFCRSVEPISKAAEIICSAASVFFFAAIPAIAPGLHFPMVFCPAGFSSTIDVHFAGVLVEVEMLGLNSDKFADPAAEFVNHLKYHCFFKFCRISI
jgi:hypothetical protein